MPNVEKLQLDKTDLDLNTSPDLPMAPITVGMSPDTLSADVRAALTGGFVKSSDDFDPQPGDAGCGKADGESTPEYVDPRGSPLNGFLGRATLLVER